MISSIKTKSKTVELQAVNVVKEKLKIDKKLIMSFFDAYFQRKEAEELEKLNELGGFDKISSFPPEYFFR